MAVDIYVGSLTCYYSGLWENQLQAHCRKNGEEYQKITPNQETSYEEDVPLNSQEIYEIITIWRDNLSKALQIGLKWDEGGSIPYYTCQFSESAEVYALSCYASYPDLNIIESFPANLDIFTDKMIKKTKIDERFCFLGAVEAFLPDELPDSGIYKISLPNERQAICSSTPKLLRELDKMARRVWGASMLELDQVSEKEIFEDYAAGKEPLMRAIFGLCKLYKGALFSQKNHLPILLDY